MSTVLEFFVKGVPAPGGSKTVFPIYKKGNDYPIMVKRGTKWWPLFNITDDAGPRNKEWRKQVGWAAKAAMRGEKLLAGPIRATFRFVMPRPQADWRSNGDLKPTAPRHHVKKPDALKLARSTEDAMTAIVWVDDAQVTTGGQEKIYVTQRDEQCGAHIRIEAFEDDEQILL